MKDLGVDETAKWHRRFIVNGYLLVVTFFLARVLFLGVLLAMYVIPTLINYDYAEAIEDIGWFKVR